jgi:lambda repressor-like predicted transcriptional regulator
MLSFIFTNTNYYRINPNMNDVQELLAGLQYKGWTLTAIADEFGISRNAVDSW